MSVTVVHDVEVTAPVMAAPVMAAAMVTSASSMMTTGERGGGKGQSGPECNND
jgi:hypothetical protein